jgi:hypothetical protein
MSAEPGMVTTHLLTISLTVFQRTALGRSEAPIPMMEELTTWVVETGAPTNEAAKITTPEVSVRPLHVKDNLCRCRSRWSVQCANLR